MYIVQARWTIFPNIHNIKSSQAKSSMYIIYVIYVQHGIWSAITILFGTIGNWNHVCIYTSLNQSSVWSSNGKITRGWIVESIKSLETNRKTCNSIKRLKTRCNQLPKNKWWPKSVSAIAHSTNKIHRKHRRIKTWNYWFLYKQTATDVRVSDVTAVCAFAVHARIPVLFCHVITPIIKM